jgi:hypothetical protein
MRIRYYCPDCRKKSILNAIYTAEPRVCAWCGFPIYSKKVQEQNEAKQPFVGFGLNICVWPCWAALLLAFPNRGDNELRNLLCALDIIVFSFLADRLFRFCHGVY